MQTEDAILFGYCHCGCGQKTEISKYTHTPRGWKKGEPRAFVKGHYHRMVVDSWAADAELLSNPSGLCQCGCGEKTNLAPYSSKTHGWIRGRPKRYVNGHHGRVRHPLAYTLTEAGFATPCWMWDGNRDPSGYGVHVDGRDHLSAHRVMYEREHGEIPEGLHIDHLCRNKSCVNPAHLEPVTPGENVRRGNNAKLDWEKVSEIRTSPHSRKHLAATFGVAPGTIANVQTGRSWPERERPANQHT